MKSFVSRRYAVYIAIFCTLCITCLTLSSCSSLISLSYENDLLIDKKNNVRYTYAPASFEPASIGEEYAEYKKTNTVLYKIPGLSPQEWLAEQYEGVGSLFYSTSIALPSLGEFEANEIFVSVSADVSITLANITDADDIAAVINALENGEKEILPATYTNCYDLKFASDKYPCIYYKVYYFDCGGDNCYIQDRGTGKCVYVGAMLREYF